MNLLQRNLLILLGGLALTVPAWAADHDNHEMHEHNGEHEMMHGEHGATSQPMHMSDKDDSVGDVYALDYCVVSGGKLGSMGKPVDYNYKGRDIRFCCPSCLPTFKADPDKYIKKMDKAEEAYQLPLYPMDTCPVSGEELINPVDKVYNNRLVRFCCNDCPVEFEKHPAKYMAKLDKAVVAAQKADYPLDTCVVSGEELGEDGEPVEFVHANRLFRFCCPNCVETFKKDPVKYHKKLDEAYIEKQKKDYPLKTCVVSGEELGGMGAPVDYLYGNELVRFCCSSCVKSFKKDPEKYLKKLHAAEK